MSSQNYFATLNAIDVSKHVEKKGNFSYLSWPYAVAQLRLADVMTQRFLHRISTSRRAVVHLLRPVGNVGLLQE